jgi:glutamate N-acetyltransferase/amino-acid N-acetyltransferase
MEISPFVVVSDAPGAVFPKGFLASGVSCDVRGQGHTNRLDMAVIYSQKPCVSASVYTRNAIVAAPVKWCREVRASGKPVHAIVANSGNANACTGPQGIEDNRAMARQIGEALQIDEGAVFVASTGRIGRVLPMNRIRGGIEVAVSQLGTEPAHGLAAADAILTSDTRRKVVGVEVRTNEGIIRIGGMAKGAGMIEPGMATMLAFITTDAKIAPERLQRLLQSSVDASFNAITVDGDMSTNDTVIVLANGASGVVVEDALETEFVAALNYVCERLARKIVGDGEKITKVVELRIAGAKSDAEAEKVARAVGNSLLVKSSWFGGDPNWGRILDAAGYSGAEIVEEQLTMAYRADDNAPPVLAFADSTGCDENLAQWKEIVARKEFIIELDLGLGEGAARLWASDLTEGYVNFNKAE